MAKAATSTSKVKAISRMTTGGRPPRSPVRIINDQRAKHAKTLKRKTVITRAERRQLEEDTRELAPLGYVYNAATDSFVAKDSGDSGASDDDVSEGSSHG